MAYRKNYLIPIGSSSGAVSHTGSTGEVVLDSCPVKGMMADVGDRFKIKMTWGYTNNANTKTLRVKIGAFNLQAVPVTTTAQLNRVLNIHLSGIQTLRCPSISLAAGLGITGGGSPALSGAALNFSTDKTINFVAQLADAADTITIHTWTVYLMKVP